MDNVREVREDMTDSEVLEDILDRAGIMTRQWDAPPDLHLSM